MTELIKFFLTLSPLLFLLSYLIYLTFYIILIKVFKNDLN